MAALELAVAYLIAGALELGDDPAAAAVYRELAVMTPEGHPESGWNTFSAYEDDDGRVVTQVQSLARQRSRLRGRLPPRRLHGAGEDLGARPQVRRRPLRL